MALLPEVVFGTIAKVWWGVGWWGYYEHHNHPHSDFEMLFIISHYLLITLITDHIECCVNNDGWTNSGLVPPKNNTCLVQKPCSINKAVIHSLIFAGSILAPIIIHAVLSALSTSVTCS